MPLIVTNTKLIPARMAERPSASRITGSAGRSITSGAAKIAAQHLTEPVPVLHRQRIVQSEFLFKGRDRIGRGEFARIA